MIDGSAESGSSVAGTRREFLVRAALGALAVVTGIHLAARLVSSENPVAEITQVLLMPLLAAALLAGTARPRGRLVALVSAALFFSWLGDTIPRFVDGDGGFLALVGCFLVAQVCYAAAFWPFRGRSLLVRPVAVVIYLVALVILVALCRENAGPLLAPVLIYGAALVTMALLATGLGPMAGVGGAIFLLSDSLIALCAFADVHLPAHSFWVMLTYVTGQVLLILAVRARAADISDVRRG